MMTSPLCSWEVFLTATSSLLKGTYYLQVETDGFQLPTAGTLLVLLAKLQRSLETGFLFSWKN